MPEVHPALAAGAMAPIEIRADAAPVHEQADQVARALIHCNPGRLYHRGREWVEPTPTGIRTVTRTDVTALIHLAACTSYTITLGADEIEKYKPLKPAIVSTAANAPAKYAPPLRNVRCHAALTTHGVALRSGYYQGIAGGTILAVPPGAAEAYVSLTPEDAAAVLDSWLADFTFADPVSRMGGQALLLEPVLRLAIEGPAPLHAVISGEPGSGKTTLGRMAGAVVLGRIPADEGLAEGVEGAYQLAATFSHADSFVHLDNSRTGSALGGPILERLTTSTMARIRVVGSSVDADIDMRGVTTCVNGNRLALTDGMARRTSVIRLTKPPVGKAWSHPDIEQAVLAAAGRIQGAILRLAASAAEREGEGIGVYDTQCWPSYAEWSRFVGGALMAWEAAAGRSDAAVIDWLRTRAVAQNAESDDWATLYAAWPRRADALTPLPAAGVLLLGQEHGVSTIIETAGMGTPPSQAARVARLLQGLARAEVVVTAGLRIAVTRDKHTKGNVYTLVGSPPPPGAGGDGDGDDDGGPEGSPDLADQAEPSDTPTTEVPVQVAEAAERGVTVDPEAWARLTGNLRAKYAADVDQDHAAHALTSLGGYDAAVSMAASTGAPATYSVEECWTGRIATRAVNLQGFHKSLRPAIIAEPGRVLIWADYRQAQLRIVAWLSGDERLQADLAAADPYAALAERVQPGAPRNLGKTLTLAVLYYAGATTCAEAAAKAGITVTPAAMKKHLRALRRAYPALAAWKSAIATAYQAPGQWADPRGITRVVPPAKRGTDGSAQLPALTAGIVQSVEAAITWLAVQSLPAGVRMEIPMYDGLLLSASSGGDTEVVSAAVAAAMEAAAAQVLQGEYVDRLSTVQAPARAGAGIPVAAGWGPVWSE